jgi:hypothetical protein
MLYQEPEPGKISNLYNIKLVNKTNEDLPVEIKLLSHPGVVNIIGGDIFVKQQTVGESVFFTILDKTDVISDKVTLRFGIYSNGKMIDEITVSFVGPNTQ